MIVSLETYTVSLYFHTINSFIFSSNYCKSIQVNRGSFLRNAHRGKGLAMEMQLGFMTIADVGETELTFPEKAAFD